MSLVGKLFSLGSGILVAGGVAFGSSQALAQNSALSYLSAPIKVEGGSSVRLTTRCRGNNEKLPKELREEQVKSFDYAGISFSQKDNLIITACTNKYSPEFFDNAVKHAIQIDKDFFKTIRLASSIYSNFPFELYLAKVAIEGGKPSSDYPTGGGENSHTGAKGISQIFPAAVVDAINYTGKKKLRNSPLYEFYPKLQHCQELADTSKEENTIRRKLFRDCWKRDLGVEIENIRDDAELNIIAGYAYGAYIMENFANDDPLLTAIMYNAGLSISNRKSCKKLIKSYSIRDDKSLLDIYSDGLHMCIRSPANSRYLGQFVRALREFEVGGFEFLSSLNPSVKAQLNTPLEIAQTN